MISKEEYAIAYKVLEEIREKAITNMDTPFEHAVNLIPCLQIYLIRLIKNEEKQP